MSYNIHHANPPAYQESGEIDINAIIEVINKEQPDVVALQEVDVNTKRSGKINEAQIIADKLGMQVFFAKAIDYDEGAYGLAILSKYPITDQAIYKLSLKADAKAEPRILQTAIINLPNNQKIRFANTHLDVLNTGNRELQAKEITTIAKAEQFPFLIAGDWNANVGSATLHIMDEVFSRTCETCPITCPEDGEQGAIDFIAFTHNSPFKTINYKVHQKVKVSDHYPITAKLSL
ncbi:endonuclease/exonuclease/phosphatase family protein [Pedobacter cryophilus]|nr:endonuclease/exonuclease/phosphatase family protein [Pedobacter cryophilus]